MNHQNKSWEEERNERAVKHKEYSELFYEKGLVEGVEFLISQAVTSERERIAKGIEAKRPERPIRTMEDLALGMVKWEQLSDQDKAKVQNHDNGFYIENVEFVVKNRTLNACLSLVHEPEKQPMEQIIKKAIEGGYEPFKTVKMEDLDCSVIDFQTFACNIKPKNGAVARGICSINIYRIVADPLFWQALGKACGWESKQHPHARISLGFEYDQPITEALVQKRIHAHVYHALRFHEINLTEGWEKAVEYLKEIITN